MGEPIHPKSIVILDCGGQYAHLIARRVRQCGAYSEIRPAETHAHDLKDAAGIILSGGPQSVYDPESPQGDTGIFDLGIPILGICYGLQWMAQALGGEVRRGKVKEYGRTRIRKKALRIKSTKNLFQDCPEEFTVWMSHGDEAVNIPEGFSVIATSDVCANAAFADEKRKFFALQFHPEVTHTECGREILQRFVALCGAVPWSVEGFAQRIGEEIKAEVCDRSVFMLVSGGVDSTVAFTLLNRVLGPNRVRGLLVDTGLMRKGEIQQICEAFRMLGIENLHVEDASDEFFERLQNVYDPEEKRRIIGETFLSVQKRVCRAMGLSFDDQWMLGQGTIYPDTIETGGTKHAARIKTHHNRIETIQRMIDAGLVVEPLKELYKDEVRQLGEELGLPHELVWRHPFPGPGLGVRILCSLPDKTQEIPNANIDIPHAVLPIRSVGVQGDSRTYKYAIVLFSESKIPTDQHWNFATEIPNRCPEFNRVLFCLSHSRPTKFVFTPVCITRERTNLLQEADAIVDEEIRNAGLYEEIWQFPVVLLPLGRQSGQESIVLRPVHSTEAMTADAARIPGTILQRMVVRILSLSGIDTVFYDLTSKPPATIEWE
ncbi:hypothetical protein A2635_01405 [Candidatus Peribacteria bacterium RIFCSPHIGHO2_01_FULL_51_9]|nr:MAG: hypothetical protein A2635_01405 [Candidatus Peribacteria bacterium RIFCSPHIGHO2_01_FULL_51_9]